MRQRKIGSVSRSQKASCSEEGHVLKLVQLGLSQVVFSFKIHLLRKILRCKYSQLTPADVECLSSHPRLDFFSRLLSHWNLVLFNPDTPRPNNFV